MRAGTPGLGTIRELTAGEFRKISTLMYERFGIDMRCGKEGLVSSRLLKKLRQGGFTSFGAYFDHVLSDPKGDALIEMVDALTTNHTSFLRERPHFDFLVKTIVPELPAGVPVAIWSAAASTGEEPYSIACTLLDALGPGARFSILATDLSTRALAKAKTAVYPVERFVEFPPSWYSSFLFKGSGAQTGSFRIRPEVANRVEFRRLNLMEPFTHGRRFHVIFCRNVMMYFDRPTQQGLVNRLAGCLEPGGYLFVGHSESLTGIDHGLRYVRPAIYAKNPRLGGVK